jgi:hypothetical protein
MRGGDIVVAYQAGTGVVGFARVERERERGVDSADVNTFLLDPTQRIGLKHPIPHAVVHLLPGATKTYESLRLKHGSVFAIAPPGTAQLLSLAEAYNPRLRRMLRRFTAGKAFL